MRSDGRASDQMRPVKMTPDFVPVADGSVLIEIGQTRVICTATVDDGVPSFLKGSGKGWVTGGIRHAAARHRAAHAARILARTAVRTHAGDCPADRPFASRGHRPAKARRAHGLARLRRHPGRRRHAHGLYHRSLRGPGHGF